MLTMSPCWLPFYALEYQVSFCYSKENPASSLSVNLPVSSTRLDESRALSVLFILLDP